MSLCIFNENGFHVNAGVFSTQLAGSACCFVPVVDYVFCHIVMAGNILQYALRVAPAETRLTVYRRLRVYDF